MPPAPQWVLDTNVIVSGILSAAGPPGRLVDALLVRQLQIVVDDRIVEEYRRVLGRPKFRIAPNRLDAFLAIVAFQIHLSVPVQRDIFALDSDDTKFLEVACASRDLTLVTGNERHFPARGRGGVRVLSPAAAVAVLAGLRAPRGR